MPGLRADVRAAECDGFDRPGIYQSPSGIMLLKHEARLVEPMPEPLVRSERGRRKIPGALPADGSPQGGVDTTKPGAVNAGPVILQGTRYAYRNPCFLTDDTVTQCRFERGYEALKLP